MATIAIDARFYGTEHTGLGRYTQNVMEFLPGLLAKHEIILYLREKYAGLTWPGNVRVVTVSAKHYSLSEQLSFPKLVHRENPDLFFAFHFNVPLLLRVPFVVTIHDLIKSHFKGPETSTHRPWLFGLKRKGYELTIKHAVASSRAIIVPTNTVKNDILALYDSDPTKITPIPEAPDRSFRNQEAGVLPESLKSLKGRYLLYVGNAYPHKNLNFLLNALDEMPDRHLVIVAKYSPFLVESLSGHDLSRSTLLSDLSDAELVAVYRAAQMLVTPSLMEGYGLPGLEALMVGTPVAASDIPVYREVYKDAVTYFDPHDSKDLMRAIERVSKQNKRTRFAYDRTWKEVAADIAEVIDESSHSL